MRLPCAGWLLTAPVLLPAFWNAPREAAIAYPTPPRINTPTTAAAAMASKRVGGLPAGAAFAGASAGLGGATNAVAGTADGSALKPSTNAAQLANRSPGSLARALTSASSTAGERFGLTLRGAGR